MSKNVFSGGLPFICGLAIGLSITALSAPPATLPQFDWLQLLQSYLGGSEY